MNKIIACMALLGISACASDEAARRPAATPNTEPQPLSSTQGAEPGTKTVLVPPENPLPVHESEPSEHPTAGTPDVK